jgi:hypothetical protein
MDVVWHPIKSEADLPPEGGVYWVTAQADDEDGQFSYEVELADWDNSSKHWFPYANDSLLGHCPARWDEGAYGDGRADDYQIVIAWASYERPAPYEGGA